MVYIKVLDHNGVVVDAQALEDPFYVKRERGVLTRCTKTEAEGIMQSDSSSAFNFAGKSVSSDLTAYEIPVGEYDTLMLSLHGDDEQEPDPEPDDHPDQAPVLSDAEAKNLLLRLKEIVDSHEERFEFNEGCIMELGDIIYG